MWRMLGAILAVGMLAQGALAGPPDRSPRPEPRPGAAAAPTPPEATMLTFLPGAGPSLTATVRPQARPEPRPVTLAAVALTPQAAEPRGLGALFSRLRPEPRPKAPKVEKAAAIRSVPGSESLISRKGSVCGDPAIKGEVLSRITAKVKGCGIDEPVRVRSVDGVVLSQPATMDCGTALALKKWVQKGLKPAFGKTGGGIARIEVAAHYACRPRNNKKGAKISEHGKGRAIDISGVTLANGKTVTVLRDYRKSAGKPLRIAHKAACGTFGTTLGPGSDGYHEDHLHLDTARYRSGAYCR